MERREKTNRRINPNILPMAIRQLYLPLLVLLSIDCFSQEIKVLTSGTKTSIRGLSAVTDKIVWVSGSAGTVGRSEDGGENWKWMTVKGFEKSDFRDIEAFDDKTAIIMAISEPAYILKTTDGGENWNLVFADSTKGMFLDAMDFYNRKNGIVVGDPVNGKFYVAKTRDGGNTWTRTPAVMQSKSIEGEGCFASSGTNIHYFTNNDFLFVTGGTAARLHDDSGGRLLPLLQGKESTGANSVAVRSGHARTGNQFIVVGGDFANPKDTVKNCFISNDGGASWVRPVTPPPGYRSCVIYLDRKKLLTCGITGVDISTDKGMNFKNISTEGFHVCRKAKNGKAVFLAGGNGKIGKLIVKK
jgi:photosystem II stability/assembly factor-like uncharacterized protein